ncbi:MAG: NAD(P)/FAD-dependent oxidoreductase [Bacteroidetes bacterium]|nr:NAD(P)/FAD-dependent oxidoreductase [Bacteroidota bacterium]
MAYDVLVIGSGLGGLLSASILSKEGFKVCVVEKNPRIGGCLQSFARDGVVFNTGLNYTESLDRGQVLYQYFKYVGIYDRLRLRKMDEDAFERITFEGDPVEYHYSQGEDRFIEALASRFPNEKSGIINYIEKLRHLSHSFPLYDLEIKGNSTSLNEYYYTNTRKFLESLTKDEKLRSVLAATNPLYAGISEKTPLYIHGIINYSFMKSAWRLVDGSSQLAKELAAKIRENGGEIFRNKKVESIVLREKRAIAVKTADGDRMEANNIISNVHPAVTMKMIGEGELNNAYRRRIQSMENTIGMFTLYAVLNENSFPYLNYNIYHYTSDDVWKGYHYNENEWPPYVMAYTPAISGGSGFANALIAITYMHYDEVKKWENTTVENRGKEYTDFKERKAELLINTLEKRIPGIRQKIAKYYTSTPLTYRDYTGTLNGSSYGIVKDSADPLRSLLMPKTRISNLYLTGQNLNLHGILGVSVNALLTCSEFLGMDYLIKNVKNADL